MADPLLEVRDLSVSFRVGETPRPVLRELSLKVGRGEILGLVGESGSGKSTLLFTVMSYLADNAQVDGGRVLFQGADLLGSPRAALDALRGRRLAMVYQDPGTTFNPSMTVGAQIVETLRRHLGLDAAEARRKAIEQLAQAHLDDPEQAFGAYPHRLSGGQKQRAVIALALSCAPDLLLMDEPTTALDVVVQARILETVRMLCDRTGVGILFVTHDLGAAARIADRVGVLYAGELMELGPAEAVLHRPRNPYTRGLIAALPRLDDRRLPRSIPGVIARSPERFARCVFQPRCAAAGPVCADRRPPWLPIAEGWWARCHFAAQPDALAQAAVPEATPEPRPARAPLDEPALLEVRDLDVVYRRRRGLLGLLGAGSRSEVKAVDGLSLSLPGESALAVVGESGSGKTSLARAVLRLVPTSAGEIRFAGRLVAGFGSGELRAFRRGVAMVFQNPTSSLNPRKTVAELVARPLRLAGKSAEESRAAAARIIPEVGLDESYLARYPAALSGGEKQRVAIARAFVTDPRLVILDEPTTALDVSVQATVLALLARLRARYRCAYLLISHDLAVVRQLADRVIVMRAGALCEEGPVEQVFARPRHPYTRELLAAVPRIGDAA